MTRHFLRQFSIAALALTCSAMLTVMTAGPVDQLGRPVISQLIA